MSKIVLLFGGTSSERMVSCASAQHITAVLPHASCWFWSLDGRVSQIHRQELLDHQNVFVEEFRPKESIQSWPSVVSALDEAQKQGAVLYVGLHGGDGENGWLQAECERRGVAFTGSGSVASALAMDKRKAKDIVKTRGIKVAEQCAFSMNESSAREQLFSFQRKFGSLVLKPACDGSSAGLGFVDTPDQLEQWWKQQQTSAIPWLAEELLRGRELTVGVTSLRGCLMVLPPSEVILDRNAKFDYQGKYLGVGNREITPAELTVIERTRAQEVSILAHTALNCFGYTRTDMMVTDRGIYYLETNTLPGLTSKSFIPQQLRAAAIEVEDFFMEQLELASQRY